MEGGLIFFTAGRRSKPGTFDIALQQTLTQLSIISINPLFRKVDGY